MFNSDSIIDSEKWIGNDVENVCLVHIIDQFEDILTYLLDIFMLLFVDVMRRI